MALGEGLEDLYVERKSNRHFYVIIAVILIVLVGFWFFTASSKTIQTQGFLEKCRNMMLSSEQEYVICCLQDDVIADCTEKRTFNIDDYVIVYANLLLLNRDLGRYHACVFHTPLETKTEKGKYELEDIYVSGEIAVCSRELRRRTNTVENSGKIKNSGEITLMKIYLFGTGLYNSTRDFAKNLDKGRLVLNLTAFVE